MNQIENKKNKVLKTYLNDKEKNFVQFVHSCQGNVNVISLSFYSFLSFASHLFLCFNVNKIIQKT